MAVGYVSSLVETLTLLTLGANTCLRPRLVPVFGLVLSFPAFHRKSEKGPVHPGTFWGFWKLYQPLGHQHLMMGNFLTEQYGRNANGQHKALIKMDGQGNTIIESLLKRIT